MAQMPQKVIDFFKATLGEERWDQVKDNTEALTKALEAAGVEYKSLQDVESGEATTEKPGETKAKETKAEEVPAAVTDAFAQAKKDFEALQAKVEPLLGLPKAIEELTAKVTDLAKSDAEKIKALAQEETPRSALWRASTAEETKVSQKEAKKLGEGPKVPEVVQEMAARAAGGA